jgi:cytochrome oxidase Cu insertion factor (SCO1/SenC/PrrC family)
MRPRGWIVGIISVALLLAGSVAAFFFKSEIDAIRSSSAHRLETARAPSFSLTERNGRTVTDGDLKGRVWVADFIFTNCEGPCPILSAGMRGLQDALSPDWPVTLVSFTVDPERDSPMVLSAYADRFGADPDRWLFLTGETDQIYRVIQDGFRLAVAPPEGSDQVLHSLRWVVVDSEGRIRKMYDGTEEGVHGKVMKELKQLVAEARQGV